MIIMCKKFSKFNTVTSFVHRFGFLTDGKGEKDTARGIQILINFANSYNALHCFIVLTLVQCVVILSHSAHFVQSRVSKYRHHVLYVG